MNRASAIATWVLVLLATTASTVLTCWWFVIDGEIIERADLRGWNGRTMLPAQELIWLAVNIQFLVLVAASVLTTVVVIHSRRSRNHDALPALSAAGIAPPTGSPR
ncbi:hypothetical protein ABCS02_26475 [Microbacterium sp. X-17]|uniref:hypothetical protein n=1 Tax=Microbacterium sp. X-17 TaxID=3144404 RepID=UPI0031F5C3C7